MIIIRLAIIEQVCCDFTMRFCIFSMHILYSNVLVDHAYLIMYYSDISVQIW